MTRIIFIIIALAFVQLVDGQDACITAQMNLLANSVCARVFTPGTGTDTICMGTCLVLFDDIISSCDATTASEYSTLISNVCGISVKCVAAQANLATNTVCTTAFSTGNDTDTICMGTCRDLFDAIISSCDATTTATYSNLTSTLCGSGDTSVLQQAFGIITLLLVAICVLIF